MRFFGARCAALDDAVDSAGSLESGEVPLAGNEPILLIVEFGRTAVFCGLTGDRPFERGDDEAFCVESVGCASEFPSWAEIAVPGSDSVKPPGDFGK